MESIQIWNKIKEYNTIILHRHVNPDGDAYGVQFGLKHLIKENLKNKKVLVAGENLDDLNYIGIQDKVVIEDYNDALVIVGDCSNKDRIDGEWWNKAKYIIKIDHHPFAEKYGDLEWVDEKFPSASEMVAKIAYDNNLIVTKEAAGAIFHGMVTDTGRFLYGKLNAQTFKLTSFLFESEFAWEELYRNLYVRSLNIIKFEQYVLNNFIITENGVAFLKLTSDILEQFAITKERANSLVNLLSNISEVYVWVFCSQDKNDEFIKLSIRSSSLKINDVAIKYGGGGHERASGVKTTSWTIVDDILNDLEILVKNLKYLI